VSPVALIGSAGRVEAITLERNELIPDGHGGVTARGTGRLETLDGIGLVFRAVGYRGIPIPGVPFDDRAGHIANVEGRVTAANAVVPGEYVVGCQCTPRTSWHHLEPTAAAPRRCLERPTGPERSPAVRAS
jgi:ferredoxin--NADP+ reductase